MKQKKSFILYRDALCILDDLTDEQAGKLFKAIRAYHEEEEVELEPIVKMAFIPIRNQFARDGEKYAKILEKRAIAGKKGGKQKQANLASASKCYQTVTNLPDTDTVNDTDTDNETGNDNKALQKSHFDYLLEIYGGLSPAQFSSIMPITEQIKDVEEFGRVAKALHKSQTTPKYSPPPLTLCQNVFAEINKPKHVDKNVWIEGEE